jgi:hypothetical protein
MDEPDTMTCPNLYVRAGLILSLCAALADCDSGRDSGDGSASASGTQGVFADRVVQYTPVNSQNANAQDWPYFFQPEVTLGAPGGTLHVASLGYDPDWSQARRGQIVLGLGDADGHRCAVNGPGDDLVIYENPFRTQVGDISGTNTEVALVEISQDNATWFLFPVQQNTNLPLYDPARYSGYAGVTPTNEGGDRFDLTDIPDLPTGFQACYVRLTDGGTEHEDYGNTQSDLYRSGADIDAVEALHSASAPEISP